MKSPSEGADQPRANERNLIKKYPVVLYTSITELEREREKEDGEIKRANDKTGRRRKAAGTVNSGEIGAINTQRPNFVPPHLFLPPFCRPSITLLREEEEEEGDTRPSRRGHRSRRDVVVYSATPVLNGKRERERELLR